MTNTEEKNYQTFAGLAYALGTSASYLAHILRDPDLIAELSARGTSHSELKELLECIKKLGRIFGG